MLFLLKESSRLILLGLIVSKNYVDQKQKFAGQNYTISATQEPKPSKTTLYLNILGL